MSIGKRIRQARESMGYTQKELGGLIGTTGSAVANYENETSHPKAPILYNLLNALQVDANFLFQDEVRKTGQAVPFVTEKERMHMKQYRSLDTYGRETVDIVLDREYQRCRMAAPQLYAAHSAKPLSPSAEEKNLAAVTKLEEELFGDE